MGFSDSWQDQSGTSSFQDFALKETNGRSSGAEALSAKVVGFDEFSFLDGRDIVKTNFFRVSLSRREEAFSDVKKEVFGALGLCVDLKMRDRESFIRSFSNSDLFGLRSLVLIL